MRNSNKFFLGIVLMNLVLVSCTKDDSADIYEGLEIHSTDTHDEHIDDKSEPIL